MQSTAALISALSDEEVVEANSLGTVTTNFVVIRDQERHASTIITLDRLAGMQRIETSDPGLLIIAVGLFLVAAAAHFSKEGGGADLPIALVGLAFLIGYIVTRKGGLSLVTGSDAVDTPSGTLRDTAALLAAINAAQEQSKQIPAVKAAPKAAPEVISATALTPAPGAPARAEASAELKTDQTRTDAPAQKRAPSRPGRRAARSTPRPMTAGARRVSRAGTPATIAASVPVRASGPIAAPAPIASLPIAPAVPVPAPVALLASDAGVRPAHNAPAAV